MSQNPQDCNRGLVATVFGSVQLPVFCWSGNWTFKHYPPVYQMAIQGSQYSFHPLGLKKQNNLNGSTIPASSDRGTASLSYVSATPLSHKVPIIPASHNAPMFCGGSISCRISPAPSFCGGSITPSSHVGSTAPNSHGGSTAPNSHGGSTLLSSHSNSILMSHNASAVMAPGSQKGLSTATNSLSRSQSYSSSGALTRIATQQSHVYPAEHIPSPWFLTPMAEYISDEEESQLLDNKYYHRLAHGDGNVGAIPALHREMLVSSSSVVV